MSGHGGGPYQQELRATSKSMPSLTFSIGPDWSVRQAESGPRALCLTPSALKKYFLPT